MLPDRFGLTAKLADGGVVFVSIRWCDLKQRNIQGYSKHWPRFYQTLLARSDQQHKKDNVLKKEWW